MFFSILFYINLKKIFKIKHQSVIIKHIFNHHTIQKVVVTTREYIFSAPEFFYKEITKNISLARVLELPGSYFTVYCNYPRMIVIIFLVNSLFIKSLVLLIPMLIMRVWLFLLLNYSTRRLNHVYRFLNVNYVEEKKYFKLELKPDNALPQDENFTISQVKENYIILCNLWEIYSTIYSFMKHIESYRNFYDSYIQLYTSFCFFLGWSIQFYINFYTYFYA